MLPCAPTGPREPLPLLALLLEPYDDGKLG